jgi:hypothetical protein
MMDDRTEIEQLYRTYWQYMIDKNAEGLRKLFTEDYCLEHMTGVKQSAETFLKGLLDGTVNPLHLIQRIRWSFQSLCASDFPTADTAECTDIYSEETYIPPSPNNSRVL